MFIRFDMIHKPHFCFPWRRPATITQYVAWMERQFNACQTPRSLYLSIFNSFRVIRCRAKCHVNRGKYVGIQPPKLSKFRILARNLYLRGDLFAILLRNSQRLYVSIGSF